jgi:hypothetical protein
LAIVFETSPLTNTIKENTAAKTFIEPTNRNISSPACGFCIEIKVSPMFGKLQGRYHGSLKSLRQISGFCVYQPRTPDSCHPLASG